MAGCSCSKEYKGNGRLFAEMSCAAVMLTGWHLYERRKAETVVEAGWPGSAAIEATSLHGGNGALLGRTKGEKKAATNCLVGFVARI